MSRALLCMIFLLVAVLTLAGPTCAQSVERPATAELPLLVHVRNGSTGLPADEGIHVIVSVAVNDQWIDILESQTAPGGVARLGVPLEMAGKVAFRCTITHAGHDFFSPPFHIAADRPAAMVVATVYDPLPPLGLPRWTPWTLTAIFVLAVALVAARRSDRQLA